MQLKAGKRLIVSDATGEASVIEEYTLSLEGTRAQIDAAVTSLGWWASEIARVRNTRGADQVYLEVQSYSGGTVWRSRLVNGEVEVIGGGADQRLTGSQGVILRLEREDFWEDAAERELYLTSQASGRVTGGAEVASHWDTSQSNYVAVSLSDTEGDLPAPVHLHVTVDGLAENGTVYVGEVVSSGTSGQVSLQGESASAISPATLTATAAASCSNDSYGLLAWSGTSEVGIRFTLSATLLNNLKGYAFLPVMRLYNAIASGEAFSGYWRVVESGGGVLAQGRPGLMPGSPYKLQAGSALNLPPWLVTSEESSPALYLDFMVQAEGSGGHQLDVDYCYLLALEHWRIYWEAVTTLGGLVVNDNPYYGTLRSYGSVQGHVAEGPGLWIAPGKSMRFYFLFEAGALTPASHTATVRMWYRPRRRVL